MKSSKNKNILIFILIAITAMVSSLLTTIVLSAIGSKGKEPLPQKIIQSKISPDGKATAILFEDDTGESWNLLGSDLRNYLGLKRNGVTYIIARDLTEGSGTYEGGVFGINWLNNHQIFIERIIGDQQNDIIFDINQENWISIKK